MWRGVLACVQVTADPADINVLPEYGHDVRVVANLFDSTYRTCDDAHLWLAPFTPGARNLIFIDLGSARTLSMVRVWNYNKSRIHSFRGARLIEIRLDGALVFRGEVNKAPGCLIDVEKAAEPILFTVDADVLQRIDEHDRQLFEYEVRAAPAHQPARAAPTGEVGGGDGASRPAPLLTLFGACSRHHALSLACSLARRARRARRTPPATDAHARVVL
jgi:hypothetical protein